MSRPEEPYVGVPQVVSGGANVPMVIIAQAPEPSVTRGVTGLFVPIFLAIFILAAIYFFFGAWEAARALDHQKAVTRDAIGLFEYMDDMERQNQALCRSWAANPERIERPNLQAQITAMRRGFDTQCGSSRNLSERLSRRSGGAAGGACEAAQPPTRTAPEVIRRTSLDEFRNGICRNYRVAAPANNAGARPNG
jgi:hypothetical protein